RADVMDAPSPGGLGGTYAGNPLACAAANAVLDRFEQGDLMERAVRLGAFLAEGFAELQARHPAVGDVRGLGPMMAMELVRDRQTREPDAALTGRVLESAREQGMLLVRAGLHGNVVRALAPLTIDKSEVARALEILDAALSGIPAVAAPSR
ncbi:MAG TPA: aminotransferase class III-fold pyridoxal phosphate-dependent enzyme, partial [Candidatus Dormibacteraeota bacterium]